MEQPPDAFDAIAGTSYEAEREDVVAHIASAPDQAGLQRAAAAIRSLARGMTGHFHARIITDTISALNDQLTRAVIDQCTASCEPPVAPWCWIALGSEGRQEQTIASDQDNGIVFDNAGAADAHRELLLPLARRINEALAACGFPLCRGGIMASNPHWCLSVHEWRERFHGWIAESDPQALLNATIFFDLRPLHGDCGLARQLLDWLARNASDNPRFLFQMAENALRRQPPIGLLRDFAVERGGEFEGTIDLKLQAATLFVDAARVYGLACASPGSNSAVRLHHATAAHYLGVGEVEEWVDAFYLVQGLRLKNQLAGATTPNRINPYALAHADRRALSRALHQARALQNHMERAFLINAQGI
ncbi:MAG TPA: DUF294 nucleotidyltransferase-like domain-containing protein [Telluria sp.]